MSAILFMMHTEENAGYAIASYERAFLGTAAALGYRPDEVHFSFKRLSEQLPTSPPPICANRLEYNVSESSQPDADRLARYVAEHRIRTVVALDIDVASPLCGIVRKAGVTRLVAYWGAPISALSSGLKLALKKVEVGLRRDRPDLFIFESQAMVETATKGRGIAPSQVALVHLGADMTKYNPVHADRAYVVRELGIPADRKIVFYSGHMEERKGVAVIVRAARELVDERGRTDLHFLLCGNKGQEAQPYLDMLKGTKASQYVTFGGYRRDLPTVMAAACVGTIASTGWDSFTMSSIEMAASGLPLLVSNLQGLAETVADGSTGYTFPPGNHNRLASLIAELADNPELRNRLGMAGRLRAEQSFSDEAQIKRLARLIASR